MLFREVEFGTPSFHEILHLRDIVLRQPLGMVFTPKQITQESNCFHFGCYKNETLLGTLLMKDLGNDTLKMRQVAVDPQEQGNGIGTFMVKHVELWSLHKKYTIIELAARQEAVNFYLKQDYDVVGEPFFEVGISHRTMKKIL